MANLTSANVANKEFKDTYNDLKNVGSGIKNNAREVYDEASEDLREVAHRAGQRVSNFVNTASSELSSATETVTSQIRTNPVQSSIAALGIGLVLGMLIRR